MVFSVLGEIRLFAGTYEPVGWAFCDGRLLDISANFDLFELLGFAYGKNATESQFGLPNLPAPAGVRYIISVTGEWPQSLDGFIGAIKLFAGLLPPNGWLPCDGRVVPVDPQDINRTRLATVLGSTYGGNGTSTTGLPLVPPISSAISVDGKFLPQYMLCVKGPLAAQPGGNSNNAQFEQFIGEVAAFAGSYVPAGLVEANGQTLTSSDEPALSVIVQGNATKSTFQVPQLAGLPAGVKLMAYLIATRGIFPPRF